MRESCSEIGRSSPEHRIVHQPISEFQTSGPYQNAPSILQGEMDRT